MSEQEYFNVADIFGENVFNDAVMQERLPKKVYKKLHEVMDEGKELDLETADVIAHEMKEWAIEKGATHYTHWFQPLTGVTAEKHDSFITSPMPNGKVLMSFSGKELIKGEPDASSFPNGGIRNTFEARGYSAWDPSSPVFVVDDTLCIPTIFIAYTGESLDYKAPLLKALRAVNKAAVDVCHYFDPNVKKVMAYLGWEQEYFLVDEGLYAARPDLLLTGRTLMGHEASKNQQLEDHYFGAIPTRVAAFMKDLEIQALELGIPVKTRHNEVAPNQFELAPIFEECNLAVDHNMLIMSLMRKVARTHGFRVLLHEKPFKGVNGSGKHNNWSLTSDDGVNLLDPGKNPHENKMFLLVLACILKAVDEHADLLRVSAADVGNDQRLGGNEAPPAVISVFLGDQLEDVLDQILKNGEATHSIKGEKFATGVTTLPDFRKDATDRNRTSPFAFTGNKFEFRMLGSQDSLSNCNVVLNTIAAEAFEEACDRLEKAEDFDKELNALIVEYTEKHKRIIFSGNGYSKEWQEEAKRRGLPNLPTMVDAIPALTTDAAIDMFEHFKVFTKAELEARAEIQYEIYAKAINIEARTMIDMATKQIIPAVVKYTTVLAESVNQVRAAGKTYIVSVQEKLLEKTSALLAESYEALNHLAEVTAEIEKKEEGPERARYCLDVIMPAMTELRTPVDALEMIVDKEMWPMPSYGDLMFIL